MASEGGNENRQKVISIYTHGTRRLSASQGEFVGGRFHYLPGSDFKQAGRIKLQFNMRLARVLGVPDI